jgi:hypothetical protein
VLLRDFGFSKPRDRASSRVQKSGFYEHLLWHPTEIFRKKPGFFILHDRAFSVIIETHSVKTGDFSDATDDNKRLRKRTKNTL